MSDSKKRTGKWRFQSPSSFDIGFEPLIKQDEDPAAAAYSLHDVLLRQKFSDAMKGKPSAVRAILKVLKANEQARAKIQDRGPRYGDDPKPTIVWPDAAMQLLQLAGMFKDAPPAPSRYPVRDVLADEGYRYRGYCLRLEDWATCLALERIGGWEIDRIKWHRQMSANGRERKAEPYCFADDLRYNPVKKDPALTQFKKGLSGNPYGRPRKLDPNRQTRELPFEEFLLETVTMQINGEKRTETRLEMLLFQVSLRAIKGDASLADMLFNTYTDEAIARYKRKEHYVEKRYPGYTPMECDNFVAHMRNLEIFARRTKKYLLLMPWIVEAALRRFGDGRLSTKEQRVIVQCTSTPEKVNWPDWWTEA